MSYKVENHKSRLGAFLKIVVHLIKKNPQLLDNIDYLKAHLVRDIPKLTDYSKCPMCDASMAAYIYMLDAWEAILLLKMGEHVMSRLKSGEIFNDANRVEVARLDVAHSIRCRTTQSSKLGLIAPVIVGGKRVAGKWCITSRGWSALGGSEVPYKVKVWRGVIEERYEDKTTLARALESHIRSVEKAIPKGRVPLHDYREDIRKYKPYAYRDMWMY